MESSPSPIPSIWQSLHSWFTPTVFFLLLNLMIAAIVVTSNLPTTNNNQENHEQQQENTKSQPENDVVAHKPPASPSILHRLKSFNLKETLRQQEDLHIAATEYVFRQTHFDLDPTRSDKVPAADDTADDDQIHEARVSNGETRFVWEENEALETVTNHSGSDPTREEEEEGQEFEDLDEVYSRVKGRQVNRGKSDTLPALMEVPLAKVKKSASMKVGFSRSEEEKTVESRRPATVRERKTAEKVEDDDDVEVDSKADDFINKFKNDLKLQRIDSIIRGKSAGRSGSRGTGKKNV